MTDLPSFEAPPVAEVACSVQYAAPMSVGVVDLLAVREQFVDSYPGIEVHPPLAPIGQDGSIELVFGDAANSMPFSPRLWFTSSDGADVVQVQRDRFGFNWRKVDSSDEYLRFEHHVRPRFADAHERLTRGLEARGLTEPTIARFELVYVNPILLQPGDTFSHVLEPLHATDGVLPEPDGLQLQLKYPLPDVDDGVLVIDARSAVRRSDDVATIFMQMLVRGNVKGSFADALDGLSVAREWIVRGFADVTTRDMHTRWGRTR